MPPEISLPPMPFADNSLNLDPNALGKCCAEFNINNIVHAKFSVK